MKVLIVDDEPLVRRALARAFARSGHTIFEGASAEEGLNLWQQQSPDVLIVDVLMPEMTGPQMIRAARAIGLKTKVLVFMSAFQGSEEINDQGLGHDLFLPKPFQDIFAVVKNVENLGSKNGGT